LGFRLAIAGNRLGKENVEHADDILNVMIAQMEVGYRMTNTELTAALLIMGEERAGVGLFGMYRLPFTNVLVVGGGLSMLWHNAEPAIEFVLPRVDLRLPVSPSWEFSWTMIRLSYARGLEAEQYEENSSWKGGSFYISSSLGMRARVDRVWERDPLPPLPVGILIRADHLLGILGPTADERSDPKIIGSSGDTNDFPSSAFAALEAAPGYRLKTGRGDVELGLPVTFYTTQLKIGVGLSALWRFKAWPFIACGLAASYFPDRYILIEFPRIILTYRPVETMEIFLKPIGFLLLIEPGRDVWVEEGLESKVPYWGMVFGLGVGWTVPVQY